MSENLRNLLVRVTDELDALNCAFREHIDDCAEPEEEHERCDATDELLEQARAALAEQAPAPCPICDANEVVELRTKHCLKCDADFAGADEMSANKAAVLAAREKRIEPDPSIAACAAITHRMVDAFKVAFHQHQRMAVTYDESVHIGLAAALSARPAQTEQQPFAYADPSDMNRMEKYGQACMTVWRNTRDCVSEPLFISAAPIAQTAPQPEQCGRLPLSLTELLQRYKRDLELRTFPDNDEGDYQLRWTAKEIARVNAALSAGGRDE